MLAEKPKLRSILKDFINGENGENGENGVNGHLVRMVKYGQNGVKMARSVWKAY